jgi:hypothetical protein
MMVLAFPRIVLIDEKTRVSHKGQRKLSFVFCFMKDKSIGTSVRRLGTRSQCLHQILSFKLERCLASGPSAGRGKRLWKIGKSSTESTTFSRNTRTTTCSMIMRLHRTHNPSQNTRHGDGMRIPFWKEGSARGFDCTGLRTKLLGPVTIEDNRQNRWCTPQLRAGRERRAGSSG